MIRRAFTLVELLVSIIILAAIAGFSVPTYQLILTQLQLNSAVESVSDFTRLAAQKTVTEQVIYGVRVQGGATSLTLFRQNLDATQTTIQTLDLPANMQIGTVDLAGGTEVRFSTAGAPHVSGTFTVRDTVRNKSRLVEIRPSGNIRTNPVEE